jgi:hypothetical protein
MKSLLSDSQRAEVDKHLSEGRGVALYTNEKGTKPALFVTWGNSSCDLPGFPPSHYGRGELHSFVPAPTEARPMVSPLLLRDEVPQIRRPAVMASQTQYPSIQIAMREGPHPRGHNGYIDVLPAQEAEREPATPPEPLLPEQQWWARHR